MIVFCAQYLFAVAPLLVAFTFWKLSPTDRRLLLLRGAVVLAIAVGLAKGGGAIYDEPRPFVVHHTHPLIEHSPDNGFPSDHTLLASACAFLLVPFSWPAAVVGIIVAIVAGVSRVACGLHWPLDIGASILFALLSNGMAYAAVPGAGAVSTRAKWLPGTRMSR